MVPKPVRMEKSTVFFHMTELATQITEVRELRNITKADQSPTKERFRNVHKDLDMNASSYGSTFFITSEVNDISDKGTDSLPNCFVHSS